MSLMLLHFCARCDVLAFTVCVSRCGSLLGTPVIYSPLAYGLMYGSSPCVRFEGPCSGLERDAGDLFTLGIWILLDVVGVIIMCGQVRVSTGTPVIYSPSAYGLHVVVGTP